MPFQESTRGDARVCVALSGKSTSLGGSAQPPSHKACVQCTLIQVARALHCCLCLCMNACRVSGDQRDTRLTLGLLGRALPAARRLSASNSTESCLFHFQPFARVLTSPQYVQGKHKRHGGGKFLAPMHARYQTFCANGVPKSRQAAQEWSARDPIGPSGVRPHAIASRRGSSRC